MNTKYYIKSNRYKRYLRNPLKVSEIIFMLSELLENI